MPGTTARSGRRGATVARLSAPLSFAGAGVLVASALAPQRTPLGDGLRRDGTGWWIAVAALALVFLTRRASARGRVSWAGLWVGLLALLNAGSIALDHGYRPRAAGLYLLGLGGALVLAGWGLALTGDRAPVEAARDAWKMFRRGAPPPPSPSAAAAPTTARRLASPVWWSLFVYGALSLMIFGAPVLAHFSSTLIAQNDIDPAQFSWFYGWWHHVLSDGVNPYLTHMINAPDGYNLAWATSEPLPGILASPITEAFGPATTYNVLALAAPATAAWTCFLLCRHVTRALAPSLLAGYLYGFSPYMLRVLQGAPDLYFVAFVPVLALLVVRHFDGTIRDRVFVPALAVTLALQFITTVEFDATSALFAIVALLTAFLLWPEHRARLLRGLRLMVFACLLAAVLVSPVLVFMVFHSHTTPHNFSLLSADLLSWVLPDGAMALASTHQVSGLPGYYGGMDYFTLPLLAIVVLWAVAHRREQTGRLLTVAFLAPAVFALGPLLRLHDQITSLGLPWAVLAHFPGLKLLVPQRFSMYAFLAAAGIVALWLAERPGVARGRWLAALAILACMLPNFGSAAWRSPIRDPRFFTTRQYARYLSPHDRVLTVPILGESMRWQAEDRFRWQLVGGGLGSFPTGYLRFPGFSMLILGQPSGDYATEIRRFAAAKGVTVAVLDRRSASPGFLKLLGALGVRPQPIGGVLLYRLRTAPPF